MRDTDLLQSSNELLERLSMIYDNFVRISDSREYFHLPLMGMSSPGELCFEKEEGDDSDPRSI